MNILDPQGPIGVAEKAILIDSLAIMLAIVLPTIIATFGFAYWFRASNAKAFHWPDWEYSGRIELVVWWVPAPTVILPGGVAGLGPHPLDPPNTPSPASEMLSRWMPETSRQSQRSQ